MATDTADPVEEFRAALAAHFDREARRCTLHAPTVAAEWRAAAHTTRTFTPEESP